MNVFVIHSGSDQEIIEQTVKKPLVEAGANVLVLTGKQKIWKREARQLMKMAQIVLLAVGKNSYKSENIAWEIRQALKMKKYVVYYILEEGNKIPDTLYKEDPFSKEKKLLARQIKSISEINDKIIKYMSNDFNLLTDDIDKLDRKELFEQYKIFLGTSESLVSRRQGVNNFYISVNTAIVSIASIAMALGNTLQNKLIIAMGIMIAGIILDLSWIRILEAYGVLNSSKMKIINMIESKLPARLYETEWEVMSDELNIRKYVSFTDSEKRIPKIFLGIYIIFVIVSLIILISPSTLSMFLNR